MRLLFIDGAESSGWQIDFFTSWDPLVNKTAHPILPHSEQWGLFCEAWEAKSWCSKTKLKFFQISPFLAEACCSFADSLCMPPSGNSTGQMGTTSAWPTQTAATAVSYLPTRKAPSVSNLLHLFVWLHERQHTLVTGQVITLKLSFFCCPGLSIDFDTEQLYWISSGNSTINRCKLDGSGLEVLEGVKGKLTKATALAIMGRSPENVKLLLH